MSAISPQHFAVAIVLLGVAAAFAAALVPFYGVAYVVDAVVLSAVVTPFVVYVMFITSLRGPWLVTAGLVLLGVTLAVVVDARFLDYDGYRNSVIYWAPLLTAAVVLAAAWLFGRRDPYS